MSEEQKFVPSPESVAIMARIKAMTERINDAAAGMREPVVHVIGSLTEFNKTIRGGEDVADVKAAMRCSKPPVGCGRDLGPDYQFADLLSAKEYQITALCQDCQDKAFAMEPDDGWPDEPF